MNQSQPPTLSSERLQDLTNKFSNLANWLVAQNIPETRKFKRMKPQEINFAKLKQVGKLALDELRIAREWQEKIERGETANNPPAHYEFHLLCAIEWLKDGLVEVERVALEEWLKTADLDNLPVANKPRKNRKSFKA